MAFTGTSSLRSLYCQSLGRYCGPSESRPCAGALSLYCWHWVSRTLLRLVSGSSPLGHELCLNKAGLLNWVLSSDRVGLLGMNKEGIVSLPGKQDFSPAARRAYQFRLRCDLLRGTFDRRAHHAGNRPCATECSTYSIARGAYTTTYR
jgi:hypothetical protein